VQGIDGVFKLVLRFFITFCNISDLFVGFYNSSLSLIGLVADTIRQLGFGCGISEHKKGEYQGYILGSQAEKKRFIEFLYHDEEPLKPCEIIETVESE